MIRTIFTIAFLFLISLLNFLEAQELWSLEKCINYAHENNIQIRQSVLNTKYQENLLKESKNSRLPNLNGQVSQNLNFGRSLTYLNTYKDVNSAQTDFGLGTTKLLLMQKEILLL